MPDDETPRDEQRPWWSGPSFDDLPSRNSADRSPVLFFSGGLLFAVAGAVLIWFQNERKLTAELMLTGGTYIKDGPRMVMLAAGVAMVALGLVLIMAAAVRR